MMELVPEGTTPYPLPEQPRLRPLQVNWVEHMSAPHLYLRDPVSVNGNGVLVPGALGPLLALCDGTRNIQGLKATLELRTGLSLTTTQIQEIVGTLDQALLLDSQRYLKVSRQALENYRSAPFRHPSRADGVYPANPAELSRTLDEYCHAIGDPHPVATTGTLVGLVSPHIDYMRGHATYAQLWQQAAPWLQDIELAIILGTDHAGSPGRLTLTRQHYATPWGPLPTDLETVEELVQVLGPDEAFEEELHHAGEHSVELALVWLHHFLGERPCPVLPILCGSFHQFVVGADPGADSRMMSALEVLGRVMQSRRCLVVAAADLAHVGPAYGDPLPLGPTDRARLHSQDAQLLDAICQGKEELFLDHLRASNDRQRICGLAPIYLALQLLGEVQGEMVHYDQCPADEARGSLVSIAGVLLHSQD